MAHVTRLRASSLKRMVDNIPSIAERVSDWRSGKKSLTSGDRTEFRALIVEADRQRDDRQWGAAEERYRAALSLNPESPGYWVQHGHMLKEQMRYAEAEISYRTACAYGVEAEQVEQHLRFVISVQGESPERWPAHYHRAATPALSVPTNYDVQALGRLLWQVGSIEAVDVVRLLRANATCDEVFAAMVKDPRFAQANMDWLEVLAGDEL